MADPAIYISAFVFGAVHNNAYVYLQHTHHAFGIRQTPPPPIIYSAGHVRPRISPISAHHKRQLPLGGAVRPRCAVCSPAVLHMRRGIW